METGAARHMTEVTEGQRLETSYPWSAGEQLMVRTIGAEQNPEVVIRCESGVCEPTPDGCGTWPPRDAVLAAIRMGLVREQNEPSELRRGLLFAIPILSPLRQTGFMTERWTPPNYDADEITEFLEIETGIPESSRRLLARWAFPQSNSPLASTQPMAAFHHVYKKPVFGYISESEYRSDVWVKIERLEEHHLVAFLDFMVSRVNVANYPTKIPALAKLLDDAGAGWMVGDRPHGPGLVRRTPEAVAEITQAIINHEKRSSDLLKRAWDAAFSAQKDPGNAYYLAIKAVEAVAIPLISPNNGAATLGSCSSELRSNAEKWAFPLDGAKHQDSVDQVYQLMKFLWGSHSDRHAGQEDYADSTAEQAQAAVFTATTLVGWFSMGLLRKNA